MKLPGVMITVAPTGAPDFGAKLEMVGCA